MDGHKDATRSVDGLPTFDQASVTSGRDEIGTAGTETRGSGPRGMLEAFRTALSELEDIAQDTSRDELDRWIARDVALSVVDEAIRRSRVSLDDEQSLSKIPSATPALVKAFVDAPGDDFGLWLTQLTHPVRRQVLADCVRSINDIVSTYGAQSSESEDESSGNMSVELAQLTSRYLRAGAYWSSCLTIGLPTAYDEHNQRHLEILDAPPASEDSFGRGEQLRIELQESEASYEASKQAGEYEEASTEAESMMGIWARYSDALDLESRLRTGARD